ncbi:MAG: ubiquinone biosynthesis protein UbiB [Gallionellales bacterium 35-53-114]|jgi:ubiquinone biosynthesis protein|nr:MAG: ubiquinone biosynthesis protein UbiB [Gallionellales bacterium 35-53-114]OYZ62995.1 MAG: ubiquinone biosynthesis protein UbiB [Gallionellales bacterium 24-53-125]OZB09024.1 MAG: ubiquinone biosynthesis protein UbiB [Gallionellales bacterium 39-52-133]HQS59293.1 AarF/UbiB family protein [Gallionellaceae bacterium]HQS76206.1 AarF/UbiB family protein [Gallionellaceae bacterium]
MLWQAISAVRDLGRLHDIASVLIRYGFGDLVRRVGMSGALERAGKVLRWRAPEELARLEPPARIRRVLEELGPTFIKLGQILATRVDLFSPEWITEFSKLQDEAPAVAFAELRAQLTADLGEQPEAIFSRVEEQPLAAASLAQVHRAWLADGTVVVLKVRRPSIKTTIEADLRLLARLAEIVEAEAQDLRRYRPREIVRQFTLSLRRELDFATECRNAERIAVNFARFPEIIVPGIYWQWTSERLNVQAYIDGIPGTDLAAVDAAGLDRKTLARRGIHAVLKMILEDGFFHADPHPGNVFYLPENRIAFIDFGMVGRLSAERRYELTRLLHGLVYHDSAAVADVLLDWSGGTDRDGDILQNEIDVFVDQYRGMPLKNINFGAMLSDLVTILREHGLALPPDLALLIKSFVTLEGLGRQLDPDFDIAGVAAPLLERELLAHATPAALARRGWRTLGGALGVIAALPQDLRQILRSARRGKLQLQIDVVPLRQLGEHLDRAASRLALSVVTAALIIGSAIVMTVEKKSALPVGLSYGEIGFIAAAIGGVWLLISIWRGGRWK